MGELWPRIEAALQAVAYFWIALGVFVVVMVVLVVRDLYRLRRGRVKVRVRVGPSRDRGDAGRPPGMED